MSNMIKAYTVRYDEVTKITIDTHFRIDQELEEKRNNIKKAEEPASDEFVEGLQAVVVETIPSEQENKEKASKLIEDAHNEAKEIIENAKKEAEQLKKDAFAAAQKKGYEEGAMQTKREAQKLKAEYDELQRKLEEEYEELVSSMEPQMAQLVAALVEKVTGILVEDKQDVILYLLTKAIKNLDKSDSYTVRVSQEDFEYVNSRKGILVEAVKDTPLYITEDSSLTKNQCMIETDLKVINCSLDAQLNNLINDLKLLGSI